jgi:hypothetical protein
MTSLSYRPTALRRRRAWPTLNHLNASEHSREVRERSINLHALGLPLSRGASSTPKVMCALSGAAECSNPAMFFFPFTV